MLPDSVPVLPLFTTTLFPLTPSAVAMSFQLRLAPLALAVKVVVPPPVFASTPTVGFKERVRSNAGTMRSSNGSRRSRPLPRGDFFWELRIGERRPENQPRIT